MEKKDDDKNVWNAAAVILDIDSGVFNPNSHSKYLKAYVNLSCQWCQNALSVMHCVFLGHC